MNENKKIAVNSFVIFIRLFVTTIISLVTARLVLQALGASDFGLYNVVGGIVALLNVINTSMVSTTYRYIAFELGKGAEGNPNKVYNTSFAIHTFFALLIIIFGLSLGLWYVNNFLNVEPSRLHDARIVFFISLLTTAIGILFVPNQGLLIAYEKFTVSAIFDITAQLFKLGGIILLLCIQDDKLIVYSIVMMAYNIIHYSLFFVYNKIKYSQIISFKLFKDKSLYKEMLSFSGWTLFGACANVGKIQGSAMIINFFFNTTINAAFAVANQVENFILMFARSLNNAAVPQITKNYSSGNQDRSIRLASYISKYTYFLMLIVAFPIILEIDFLLELWLKIVPEGTSIFCQLMVIGGLIGCLGEGIPALIQATGKIKFFQLFLSSLTLLGLPISIMCYKLGTNPYSILVVYCIISFVSAFIRLYLLKRIINMDIKYFIKTSYWRIFIVSCPLFIAFLLYKPINFSIGQHLLGIVSMELFLIIVILCLGFDSFERVKIKNFIDNRRKK